MKKIIVILLGLLTLSACGFATPRSTSSGYSTVPSYSYTAPAAKTVTAPTVGTIPSGEWLVPTEVQPGLYRSAGPSEGFITYCQVTTEDKNGHVLEWKNAGAVGENVMVKVSAGAVTVRNSDCATFTKVG